MQNNQTCDSTEAVINYDILATNLKSKNGFITLKRPDQGAILSDQGAILFDSIELTFQEFYISLAEATLFLFHSTAFLNHNLIMN